MSNQETIKLLKYYFKYNKRIINLFLKQINNFNDIKNNNQIKKNNHELGDEIKINKNTLIHGSRAKIEDLEKISNIGLIAPEFLTKKKINNRKKKPFVVEFWNVNEEMPLKNYINKYTGLTIEFNDNTGNLLKRIIVSVDEVKNVIRTTKKYRDYIIYQNQEQRFLPNDNYQMNLI